MAATTAVVDTLSGAGTGYLVTVALGAALTGAAVHTAAKGHSQSPTVSAAALAGSLAVLAQLAVARQSAGTPVGFLLGTLGGTLWYGSVIRRHDGRTLALCRWGLAVGALLWIAGTVTITVSLTAAAWPLLTSLLLGVAVPGALGLVSWHRTEKESTATRRLQQWATLGAAFVLPATVGVLLGAEILFVGYLVVFATAVIVWSLCRLAFDANPS